MKISLFSEKGPLLVLLGALFFSTTGFAQTQAPEGASPYVIGALRMLGGGVCLGIWCLFRGYSPCNYRWPLRYLLPSSLALVGFQLLFFKGLLLTGLAVGTVVSIGFSPVAVAVMGWLVLGEKPLRVWYPATGLALVGLVLLNFGGTGEVNPAAVLLPLGAGFAYASYFVFSKPLAQNNPPELVMMMLCLISGVCLLPVFWLFPVQWILSPRGLLVAAHLSIITTAGAFSLTLAGLRTTKAATASTLSLAEPLGAALLGLFFLHETVSGYGLTGMGCILAGVILLMRGAPAENQ